MVYSRYIKKGGKTFGPYYYESYRDHDGKIISRYLKDYKPDKKRNNILLILCSVIIIIGLFLGIMINSGSISTDNFSSFSFSGFVVDVLIGEDDNSESEVEEEVDETIVEVEVLEEVIHDPEPTQDVEVTPEVPQESVGSSNEIPEEVEEDNETQDSQSSEIIEDLILLNDTEVTQENETNEELIIVNKTEATNKTQDLEETEVTQDLETVQDLTRATNIAVEENKDILVVEEKDIETVTSRVVLGRPVKWIKKINASKINATKLKIEIPKEATKIFLKKGDDIEKAEEKIEDYNSEILKIESKSTKTSFGITSFVISENIGNSWIRVDEFFRDIFSFTGFFVAEEIKVTEKSNSTDVIIENITEEFAIEYETPAPYSIEEDISSGKRIKIVGPDEIHYENVLAFSEISEDLDITNPSSVSIYWIEEDIYLEIENIYDLDLNGIYDYIEWNVPHLSNQTFDITITILNPLEYLVDGDTWTVYFNTTGVGNLTVYSINSSFEEISNDLNSTNDEMEFLDLKCGNESLVDSLKVISSGTEYNYYDLNNSLVVDSFMIEDYSCSEVGEFSSFMNIAGYAVLNFTFADESRIVSDLAVDPDPINISNCIELQDVDNDLSASYILINDIDCSDTVNWNSGAGFLPIGNSTNKFNGTFEGNNYIISNLFINRPSVSDIGLFGHIIVGSIISHVGLENINITGNSNVGGLVGGVYADSSMGILVINQTYTSGLVSGNSNVGGLLGYMDDYDYAYGAKVDNSYSSTNVSGNSNVGGLVGMIGFATLNQTYTSGLVSGNSAVGGLLGFNEWGNNVLYNSYWDNESSGQSNSDGAVGKTTSQMKNISTFAGWNIAAIDLYIDEVWKIDDTVSYPLLGFETYTLVAPTISVSSVFPTSSANVSKDKFFNYTVNVTCYTGDCGEINVTLDPVNDIILNGDFEIGDLTLWTTSGDYTATTVSYDAYSGTYSLDIISMIDNDLFAIVEQNFSETSGASQLCFWGNGEIESNTDYIYVDIIDSGDSYNNLVTLTGEDLVSWTQYCYDISAYNPVKGVRFRGQNDMEDVSNFIIDDVCLADNSGSCVAGGKGIVPTGSGYPFYTNATTNPLTINLSAGESELVTFYVNATGDLNSTHEFFVYANITSNMTVGSEGTHYNLTIVQGPDTTPPTFTNITNITNILNTSLSYDVNATDNILLDSFFINDTTNFLINSVTGILTNNTILSVGTYYLNVSVNDTSGNLVSEIIWISVGEAILNIINPTTASPTNVTGGEKKTIIFNYLVNGVNTTSGVVLDNLTIGGNEAAIEEFQQSVIETFNDTFTESSNTLLSSHIPTGIDAGSGWTLAANTAGITASVIASTDHIEFFDDANGYTVYTMDDVPGASEYNVSIKLTAIDSSDDIVFLVGRYTDTTHTYQVTFSATASYNKLNYINGGSVVTLDTASSGVAAGDDIIFEITDSAKNVYKNGVLWMSSNDNTVTPTGNAGLGCGNFLGGGGEDCREEWRLDNFNIIGESSFAVQEFAYVSGVGWQANVTTPYLLGAQDLFISATYGNTQKNDTEIGAFSYALFELTPPVFTVINNITINPGESLSFNINATDDFGISTFWVNDSDFLISSTGLLTNATILSVGKHYLNVSVNDTNGNIASEIIWVDVLEIGILDVTLISPIGLSNIQAQNTFFNAVFNVSCSGSVYATCGSVDGRIRYNLSSTSPDTNILSGSGTPFYTIESNLQSCGVILAGDSPCSLIWQVNTTGNINTEYLIDSNFVSTLSVSNNTDDFGIKIIDIIPPVFTSINNITIDSESSLGHSISATDNFALDSFSINDTINFAINPATGFLVNITTLNPGIYYLNVSVNDTSGNIASEIIWILVKEYLLEIVDPSTTNYEVVSGGENKTITFNYSIGGVNITSGVTLNNVTIGGQNVPVVMSFEGLETTSLGYADFDSGSWDSWASGGVDAIMSTTRGRCGSTTHSVDIRDDDEQGDLSQTFDLSSYSDGDIITLSWSAYYNSLETSHPTGGDPDCTGETMEVMLDGVGQAYYGVLGTCSGSEFHAVNLDVWYDWDDGTVPQTLSFTCGTNITCDSSVEFKFRPELSGTGDHVFIDCINITVPKLSEEFGYISGQGWQVNVTVPSGLTGFQDLFVSAIYNSVTRTNTEIGAFFYGEDTVPPVFTDISNITINEGTALSYDINATDVSALDSFFINDTTNFAIDSVTGVLTNNTALSFGTYYLNVSVNDTAGNIASEVISINVIELGSLNVVLISPTGLSNTQAQNTFFNATFNVSCAGSDGATCGSVGGRIRYNLSSSPDTNLPSSSGTPFYTIETNLLDCGVMNVGDNDCSFTWQVNATGSANSQYLIDANFLSTDVSSNNTEDFGIKIIDVTLPVFTSINNITINEGISLSNDIDATDDTAVDVFFINDTINFAINSATGVLTNNTILSIGVYYLNVSVNDTSGNVNSEIIWVNVEGYVLEIIDPSTTNYEAVSGGENKTITFNYLVGGSNITSGVTLNNVTIGGIEATTVISGGGGGTISLVGDASDNTNNVASVVVDVSGIGIQDDDLILFFASCDGTNGMNLPDGAGFSLLHDVNTPETHNNILGYKVASSEPSSYTASLSSGTERCWVGFIAYRGVDTSDPIDQSNSNTGGSDTTGVITSITPSNDDSAVVVFVGTEQGNAGNPIVTSWASPLVEQNNNVNGPTGSGAGSSSGAYADIIQTTKTAVSGNIGVGASGSTNWGVMVAVLNPGTTQVQEFSYEVGVGWQANVTVPSGLSGYQNLFVNATYSGVVRTSTETGAFLYSGGNDTTPPVFTDIANLTINEGDALNHDINATDDVGLDVFWINDTVNFAIDSASGVLTNNTVLSSGNYYLNITVNDTSGNIASEIIWVDVLAAKTISVEWITPTENSNLSKDEFNLMQFNVSCLSGNCGTINVTLDPISGCDVASTSCTSSCDDIFVGSTSGWVYDTDFFMCVDDTFFAVVASDSDCDIEFGPGNGDCAGYFPGVYCPSFERNGNVSVLTSDCSGGSDYDSTFDLSNEFFTGPASTGKGIVPTGSGTPFYTNATTNPLTTTSLSSGQSEIVSFWVNATGDLDSVHEFFTYVNLTSDLSITNETAHYNMTIVDVSSEDTTPPILTDLTDITVILPSGLSHDFDATDNVAIDTFTVNDSDFSITSSGLLTNSTPLSVGRYYLNISVSDTSGNVASGIIYVDVIETGVLNVILVSPIGNMSNQPQNVTFNAVFNASCSGSVGATCGSVDGRIRYNLSSTNPDTNIPSGSGTPFYTIESNLQSCGTLNVGDSSCSLVWEVNATGSFGSVYLLDANFVSSLVSSNDTDNFGIKIIEAIISIVLSNDLFNVDFGDELIPGSVNVPAVNNTAEVYDITCYNTAGNCNVSIKGNSDLNNGINNIGIGNISWNGINDNSSKSNLGLTNNIINSSLFDLAVQKIFFWLDLPSNSYAGDYKTNFTISAQSS